MEEYSAVQTVFYLFPCRGFSRSQKQPFRKWFGLLGEIRSLLQNGIQMSVFTATATKLTKDKIFEVLGLIKMRTYVFEKSPLKHNLRFSVEYVANNMPIDKIFAPLLENLKRNNCKTARVIIFCQTRNQVALIWRTFEFQLGSLMYGPGESVLQNRIVEMFHAGTPPSLKNHILQSMAVADGIVRVLVSTVAFGMGVNCRGVNRIIHFGPSKSVESYLQECGRAGRDGSISYCHLLYNGFLQSNCNADIQEYIYSSKCRRELIEQNFPGKHPVKDDTMPGCACCDICSKNCGCNSVNEPL